MQNLRLNIPDMSCCHCISSISKVLDKLSGVKGYRSDLDSKTFDVEIDSSMIDEKSVIDAIDKIGFEAYK